MSAEFPPHPPTPPRPAHICRNRGPEALDRWPRGPELADSESGHLRCVSKSGLSVPMHSRLRWLETLQECLGSGARREDFGFSRGWGGGHRRAGGAGGDVLRLRA